MKNFNFYMPTQIRFGAGRLNELREILPGFGKRCLIVSRPVNGSQKSTYEKIHQIMEGSGVSIFHYDKIVPNPTTTGVEEGIAAAKQHQVDFVLGVGGGSVMDSAKLIAFLYNEAAQVHWDDAVKTYANPFAIGPKPDAALPFIAVTTTSGSGSQCTQAAVVSDLAKKEKVTLFHSGLFPSVAIVDPELMLTVPAQVTAATGFDAFTHAFESYLGSRTSPVTESMSLGVIKTVFENLPKVINNPTDLEARSQMAWADTTAGMCLANGGADLPHPLGEIIGGICPRIAHGDTLAIVYPEFLKFKKDMAKEKFETVSKHLSNGGSAMPVSEKLAALFEQVNLNTALQRANLTVTEKQLMSTHPLLNLLNPENADRIKAVMTKSIEI